MKLATQGFGLDFDSFYQANFRDTVSVVFGLTADMPEAQDIAQDAFVRAWQRWDSLANYDNPVFWVRRVATNLAVSRWRKVKVATTYLARQRPLHAVPELSPANIDIINAIKQLPVTQRKAIALHYLVDMSVEDVAAELDVPLGTVKSWLHRGRAALSEQLVSEVRTGVPGADIEQVRKRSSRRQAVRGVAATVAVFLAVLIGAIALLKPGAGGDPQPPATPQPSISPAPLPMVPALPSSCKSQHLPMPPGMESVNSIVRGGDPSGKYLYGTASPGTQLQSLIWTDGVLTSVFPIGQAPGSIRAMNIHGVAVGVSGYSEGPLTQEAWYVRGGNRYLMRGIAPHPVGINASNIAVGMSDRRAVVWRDLAQEPEYLALPAGYEAGNALSISDDGLIVGIAAVAAPLSKELVEGVAIAWHPNGDIQILDSVEDRYYAAWLEGNYVLMQTMAGQTKRLNLRTGEVAQIGLADSTSHGWLVTREPTGNVTISDGDRRLILDKSEAALDSAVERISVPAVSSDGKTMGGYAVWPVDFRGLARQIGIRWTCT